MKRITSRLHKKQRNAILFFGLSYVTVGGIDFLINGSATLRWFYILTGLFMLAVLSYQLYSRALFSEIGWDEEVLFIRRISEKPVFFKRKDIKTIKLTDKSLTINAGMGDGELIDLDYFKKKDLAFFKQDFVESESVSATS
ncbi:MULTISPECIES: hypothetical protein [unclassified Leeuwenhoekiella]|uniref:hypothetical protein n=1 Tax=unclassified Leeuwenhoekiella TaxID=2615029 RepID=UPI000C4531E2|nr:MULTISPECIES: hypothetical protein [unclassified Leeuwenhoekiella]MAW94844.1 hypothetical protein [Leeuwenhoekiella sp.]MBA79564.1 hypothetical protein [Leeuwenhoekiella sp.]